MACAGCTASSVFNSVIVMALTLVILGLLKRYTPLGGLIEG